MTRLVCLLVCVVNVVFCLAQLLFSDPSAGAVVGYVFAILAGLVGGAMAVARPYVVEDDR